MCVSTSSGSHGLCPHSSLVEKCALKNTICGQPHIAYYRILPHMQQLHTHRYKYVIYLYCIHVLNLMCVFQGGGAGGRLHLPRHHVRHLVLPPWHPVLFCTAPEKLPQLWSHLRVEGPNCMPFTCIYTHTHHLYKHGANTQQRFSVNLVIFVSLSYSPCTLMLP